MVMISVCLCLDMFCPLVKRDQAFFNIKIFGAGQVLGAKQIQQADVTLFKIAGGQGEQFLERCWLVKEY